MVPDFKNFGFAPGVKGFPTKGMIPNEGMWATFSIGEPVKGETFESALEDFTDSLPTDLDICFSGKDSLLLAHYAKMSGRNINLFWLDIENDPNRAVVTKWAKQLGVALNVVSIDMATALDYAVTQAPTVKVNKPTYLLVPYLFSYMQNFVLIGEGDPEKSAGTYTKFVLTPGQLVLNAAEFSYDASLAAAGKEGYGAALSATPALVRTAQSLVVLTESGDLHMLDKYRELLVGFDFVEKTDNWASERSKFNQQIRSTVSGAYPDIISNVTCRALFA